MNLDPRTLQLIIGILERTLRNVVNYREGLPKYTFTATRKANLDGKIEALEETINLLKNLKEDQQ